jgi:hypothetical protein
VGLLAQKNAPLRLRFSEGALDVSAQTPDVGEASGKIPSTPAPSQPLRANSASHSRASRAPSTSW